MKPAPLATQMSIGRKYPFISICAQFLLTMRGYARREDQTSKVDLLDIEEYEKVREFSSGGRQSPFSVLTFILSMIF